MTGLTGAGVAVGALVLAIGTPGTPTHPRAAAPAAVSLQATSSLHPTASPKVGAVVADTATAGGTSGSATQPPAPPVTPPAPAPVPVPVPTVAALIGQAEAAGIDPGPNWSWSMGDTAAQCGAIAGAGVAKGCTSWASGVIRSVFTGSPALPLVAHELANAETEADAVPALLSQVASTEAGSSWSPTDAVASCLVVHFLGFQDNAAGTWQCPPSLAEYVAQHIHDTVTTTVTTAVCGTTSNVISTLTFTASSGTLTVTAPAAGSPPQTVPAGTPVTVSGTGTFTAVTHGGTSVESGVCEG